MRERGRKDGYMMEGVGEGPSLRASSPPFFTFSYKVFLFIERLNVAASYSLGCWQQPPLLVELVWCSEEVGLSPVLQLLLKQKVLFIDYLLEGHRQLIGGWNSHNCRHTHASTAYFSCFF